MQTTNISKSEPFNKIKRKSDALNLAEYILSIGYVSLYDGKGDFIKFTTEGPIVKVEMNRNGKSKSKIKLEFAKQPIAEMLFRNRKWLNNDVNGVAYGKE